MDGGLRQLFKKHLPEAHWQGIETGGTGLGIPDMEYCFPGGITGWVENKLTNGWAVNIAPHQVAWAERRIRAGGRVFLAVRRQAIAGPRRGVAVDELWLFRGQEMRAVAAQGLGVDQQALGVWDGGPAKWCWVEIKRLLIK